MAASVWNMGSDEESTVHRMNISCTLAEKRKTIKLFKSKWCKTTKR